MSKVELIEALKKLSTNDAEAMLQAFEKKRREESFIKYWEAQPQQAKALKLWTPDKKIFAVLGGNRSGKTDFGAFLTAVWALGKDYFRDEPAWEYVKDLPIPKPPNNIWVVGLDYPIVRDVLWREKLIRGAGHPAFIPTDALEKDPNESDFQIFFENGSVITCKSAESGPNKFQSASIDLIWIDEEPEESIFNECYQRTADRGGKILVTLTPLVDVASGVRTPWVHDLWLSWKEGHPDVQFVQFSVLDNPHIPEDEKVRLVKKWAGHPEEKARLYGDFYQRSGLVYPRWSRKTHLRKSFTIPREWPCIVSIDPAATGPTAAVWLRVDTNNNLWLTNTYKKANLTVGEHAANIKVRQAATGAPVDVWLIDPKWASQRNASDHKTGQQLYRDAGLPVRLAELNEDYGLNESREYLNASTDEDARHPKFYVFDHLTDFIDEIESYTWATFDKGEKKGLSKEKPMKRNDHLLNAWQYGCAMQPKSRIFRPTKVSRDERVRESLLNSYS